MQSFQQHEHMLQQYLEEEKKKEKKKLQKKKKKNDIFITVQNFRKMVQFVIQKILQS